MPNQLPIIILLAEDEETDAFFAKQVFQKSAFENEIHYVKDGEEVISFLKQRDSYENAPRPDLVLLDIKMPRKDGHETLTEIKTDNSLRDIPVIVFSGSDSPEDVKKSYQNMANAHVPKSKGLKEMQEFVNAIETFWFAKARLPQSRIM